VLVINLLSIFNLFFVSFSSGADNPTYLKEPGDKLKLTLAFTGVGVGLTCIFKGLWDMSWGVNKKA
jgi:hypothetical protein